MKKRVIILGGGFGGVYTAIHLERVMARYPELEVTLVDKENFLLFTPMLHEVAASDLDLTNIVSPIRKLLKRVQFFQGEVLAIDLGNRQVKVRHGPDYHSHALGYDALVLSLGAVTGFYGLPGVEERALTMKTLADAARLRSRLIQSMETADTECAAADRGKLMTVVVVGGGFSGVETAGSVNDFVRASLRFYRNLRVENVRMVLVHPRQFVLPELGEELGKYAGEELLRCGVEVIGNAKVTGVDDVGVRLSNGQVIETSTVVWTAGTAVHPLAAGLPCIKERNKIKVDATLKVEGVDGVWALGDCALIPDVDRPGQFHPPTAQHAIRQAKTLARNVAAAIFQQGEAKPFRFKTLGQLAAIGRRAGVAKVFGLRFSGFPAWFLWRSIYLMKLPRVEKKIRVAFDWTLDLFFSKDLVHYFPARETTVPVADPIPERRGPVERAGEGGTSRDVAVFGV